MTGIETVRWNEREAVAIAIAVADGKRWDRLPNVSTLLWFKDKLHYRYLSLAAIAAVNSARRTNGLGRLPTPPQETERTEG